MAGAIRIQAVLLAAIMTVATFTLMAGGDAPTAPPSRGALYKVSENHNVSFSKPTFYGTDDPYYSVDVAQNTWDDIAMVVYFQDRQTTTKTVGSYSLNVADIYQAAYVPVDGTTVSTGTQQRVLIEDFTAVWCTYCTGVVGAMERMDHDTTNNLFPDKYIGIEFHASSSSDVYYKADSNTRGTFYTVPGYPTYVIDGTDPTVGGSTNANDSAVENNIRSRVSTAGANAAPLSIVAKGGHDSSKCWVDFTVTVEDNKFDNKKVDCFVVLVQDAFPRRHNVPAGSSEARLGLICEDINYPVIKIFENVVGTPPTISGIEPSEGATISGDAEIKFTATDVDAASSKITSKVWTKKVGTTVWNILTKTDNKYIWKTASMSGDSYLYPDGDYQIKINATDYWDESTEAITNVKLLNPDDPKLTLNENDLKSQIGTDNKIAGVLDIKWNAVDDEDATTALTASLYYKRSSDTWTAIAENVPNTNNYAWDTANPRVPDGNKYRLLVKVKDTSGREVEAGTTFDFTINNPDAPTLQLNSITSEGLELSKSAILKWTAMDDEDQAQNLLVDIYMSKDGGTTYEPLESGVSNTGSKQIDTTKFADGGNYRLRVIVKDSSGLMTSAETAIFSIYNNDAPVGAFINPGQDDKVSGVVSIQWSSDDEEDAEADLKVDLFYMSSSGEYWTDVVRNYGNTGSYDWDTTVLEEGDGVYTLKLVLKDTRGVLSPSYTVYFEVYNPDEPVITNTQAPTKAISGSGMFSWIATDPDPAETELLTFNTYYSSDMVDWVLLDSAKPNTGKYTWDVSAIADGTYYLKIEVPDPTDSSLVTSFIFPGIIVNNPDAPTVSFTQSPINGANVTGIVNLAWQGDDPDEDSMVYSVYYRKFGTVDWASIATEISEQTFAWNTSKLKTADYEIMVVAKDSSSAHLQGSSATGPFMIYVPPAKDIIIGGGGNGGKDNGDTSNDSVIYLGIALLVLMLIVVLMLVAVVVIKRRKESAPVPLGGMMPPMTLPQPGQEALPAQGQTALPGAAPNQLPPAPAQTTAAPTDPSVQTGAIQAPAQTPPPKAA